MKFTQILLACFLIVTACAAQAPAFEIMPGGKGLIQYRLSPGDLIYLGGDGNNIDITASLQRNGISQRNMSLHRIKVVINGACRAEIQTRGDNGIHTMATLNVTGGNRILTIPNPAATKNRRWNIILSNHNKKYAFKQLHVTVSK